MRVGIITKIGKNYGALLQAYALKTMCERLKAEAHIIGYMPKISQKSYKVLKYPWGRRGSVANVKALLHYREHRLATKRCLSFREEFYDLLGKYHREEELLANPPKCDLVISGSDQVWNPEISFDGAFYGTFVKNRKDVKLASYAASIGLWEIPSKWVGEFADRVHKFDYVSVREKQAKRILDGLDIPSVIAPDPTLLFTKEEWGRIATPAPKEPYILCYFVSLPAHVDRVVEQAKEKLGYSVINLMTSEDSCGIGDKLVRDAGPKEFLGLFAGASFVITSSYHGTVFSIINEKPFLTVMNEKKKGSFHQKTSSRIEDLLEELGMGERLFFLDGEKEKTIAEGAFAVSEKERDRTAQKLEEIRKRGVCILQEILEEKDGR